MKVKFVTFAFVFLFCFYAHAQKSVYVIVHGAWGGAWQFKTTADLLESQGNKVYRVTLTGLGERSHLSNKNIDLNTHIKDVVNTVLFERLDQIVLVGHSYGGMVITGVADSIPHKIKRMVYLDAFLPKDGESVFALTLSSSLLTNNPKEDGFIIPSWVSDTTKFPRDVPHPIKTLESRIALKNQDRFSVPSTYILTYEGNKEKDMFFPFYERAVSLNWKVIEFEANHNPQVGKTKELVELLLNER